jgi:hypothetical protein
MRRFLPELLGHMDTASKLTLVACGIFFLVGLLTGVWKYLSIWKSPISQSPRYVNVAHLASLQYSFAALVLLKLLEFSPYTEAVNLIVVSVPLFFFAAALVTYILHAALRDTDNQFQQPYRLGKYRIGPFAFHSFVSLLVIGEVGGFVILLIGAIQTLSMDF